ncbi:MAG: hypothetical protein KME26_19955 [Oscillatoria princeps RMCB-10]|nr:hypothetical protein [Oscillatoria princeps RMCB-10]
MPAPPQPQRQLPAKPPPSHRPNPSDAYRREAASRRGRRPSNKPSHPSRNRTHRQNAVPAQETANSPTKKPPVNLSLSCRSSWD